jgi:hypothetical protein
MALRRQLRVTLGIGGALALASGALAVAGLDAGLLHLAPALVLLAPLLAGRYVGEERLAALAEAWSARGPRAAAELRPAGRAPRGSHVHGGRLIARALGVRGPPAASPALR